LLTLSAALPVWKQSLTILPDGVDDPQWFNDCGETCLAMALAAVRGTPMSPGSIRANLGGPARSGLTNGTDLVNAAHYYHLKAHLEQFPASKLSGWITAWSILRKPTIVLGTWPTPGGVLHWLLTTGGSDKWYYINPWSGARSFLSWSDMEGLYAGEIVAIDEPVAYDMSKVAMPY
jgi:hypothetical protein